MSPTRGPAPIRTMPELFPLNRPAVRTARRRPPLGFRSTALAVSALVIGAAALAFDTGRTTGAASCQPFHYGRSI
jgi:hypothetical protein